MGQSREQPLHARVFPFSLFGVTIRITNVTSFKKRASGYRILRIRDDGWIVRWSVTSLGFSQIVDERELQHALRQEVGPLGISLQSTGPGEEGHTK